MARTSRKKFAEEVSAHAHYMDPDTVQVVYQGMLKALLAELRLSGKMTLPDLGTFKITEHKGRNMSLVRSGEQVRIPAIKTVKFEPCEKLKFYFRNLSDKNGDTDS